MKKPLLKALGLLLCSSVLITGCYNGWDTIGKKSSSETQESESSSESIPDIPVDPEDYQVDLTFPLEVNEINYISPEKLEEMFVNSMGSTLAYAEMKEEFGEYFLDFIGEHNHMTDKEFNIFLSTLWQLVMSSDNDEEMTYSFVYNILYAVAYINADNLFQTVQEIAKDKTAYGYFTTVVFDRDPLESDFFNADYVLKGSNSYIHQKAMEEKAILDNAPFAATLDDFTALNWDSLYKIAMDDNSNVFFRFLHRFFRSMIRHLDDLEMAFVIYNTFLQGATIDERAMEEAMDYVSGSPESMLRFVHHIGAWFSEVNVTGSTFGVCYPAFKEVFKIILEQNYYYEDAAFVETSWINQNRDLVADFFEELNPEGLRALIKFIGLVGTNMTLDQLYAFMGEENEEGVVPSGQLIIDLYNKQFGMLKGSEKTGMTEAAAAFGIDFNELIEEFKKVMGEDEEGPQGLYRDSDHGDDEQKTLQDVFNEYVAAKVGEKFDFGMPTVFSRYRLNEHRLIIKQGVNYTAADFDKYLQSNTTASIGVDPSYFDNAQPQPSHHTRDDSFGDYVYEQKDNDGKHIGRTLVALKNDFNTDLCGAYEIDFTIRATFIKYTYDDQGNLSVPVNYVFELDLTLPYTVVPNNINEIFGDYYDSGLRNGDNWLTYDRVVYDSNNCGAVRDYQTLYVLKDANYAANEFNYRMRESGNSKFYSDTEKRFISYRTYDIYESQEAIFWLSDLDTSTLGIHYAYGTANYVVNERVVGNTEICFRYFVVESLPTFETGDIDTPVK